MRLAFLRSTQGIHAPLRIMFEKNAAKKVNNKHHVGLVRNTLLVFLMWFNLFSTYRRTNLYAYACISHYRRTSLIWDSLVREIRRAIFIPPVSAIVLAMGSFTYWALHFTHCICKVKLKCINNVWLCLMFLYLEILFISIVLLKPIEKSGFPVKFFPQSRELTWNGFKTSHFFFIVLSNWWMSNWAAITH